MWDAPYQVEVSVVLRGRSSPATCQCPGAILGQRQVDVQLDASHGYCWACSAPAGRAQHGFMSLLMRCRSCPVRLHVSADEVLHESP